LWQTRWSGGVVAFSCCHTEQQILHRTTLTSPCVFPQVDLYENGTIAIVEAVSPELGNRVQRVRVQLPGTSAELLSKFREKKIDFAAHSNTEDGGAVFLNLLGELKWPILAKKHGADCH
jgi:hypothetical protein